jgi:hypothetical protein
VPVDPPLCDGLAAKLLNYGGHEPDCWLIVVEESPMGQEEKHSRFQELRQRQREQTLTETEQAELQLFTQALEAAEAVYLTPATERLRQERKTVEAQNRTLEALAGRQEALVVRLHPFAAEARAEHREIT